MDFASSFAAALPYNDFLERYGNPEHRRRWAAMHERIKLRDDQKQLLAGFKRDMKVLVMAGAWCGDCVEQCPIFDHFAAQNPKIDVRYVDRDDCGPIAQELSVCGAPRVPAVLFASEDNFPVARYGDKTLAKFRSIAAKLEGTSCSSGLFGPADPLLEAVVQDWLNEFERVALILRLSGRLREKYGD